MGTQLSLPKKGTGPLFPIFGPCLLWPNGRMDQDGTWHGGRPQIRRVCVRWGPSLPSAKKAAELPPQFSAHFYCGQTAGCIKMPLCMEVGLNPRDFVLDGDPASPLQKGSETPNFRPMSIMAKRLDGSKWHLAWRWGLVHATLC